METYIGTYFQSTTTASATQYFTIDAMLTDIGYFDTSLDNDDFSSDILDIVGVSVTSTHGYPWVFNLSIGGLEIMSNVLLPPHGVIYPVTKDNPVRITSDATPTSGGVNYRVAIPFSQPDSPAQLYGYDQAKFAIAISYRYIKR
jgi:hypothetical protein